MPRRAARRSPATVRLIPYPAAPSLRREETRAEGSLALAPDHAPPGSPGPPGTRLRAVPDAPAGIEPDLPGAARAITQLIVEVLTGARPAHHLGRRATPSVCADLGLATPRPVRPGHPGPRTAGTGRWPAARPRVVSWRVQEPVPGPAGTAAEVSAVVRVAGRVHAVALRLEPFRGRWFCTAIETTLRPA